MSTLGTWERAMKWSSTATVASAWPPPFLWPSFFSSHAAVLTTASRTMPRTRRRHKRIRQIGGAFERCAMRRLALQPLEVELELERGAVRRRWCAEQGKGMKEEGRVSDWERGRRRWIAPFRGRDNREDQAAGGARGGGVEPRSS